MKKVDAFFSVDELEETAPGSSLSSEIKSQIDIFAEVRWNKSRE